MTVDDSASRPPAPATQELLSGVDALVRLLVLRHELDARDGLTYIMQAYSQIKDPNLQLTDLDGLGDRLALPKGWTYRTRTLDAPLDVVSQDGVATVIQDELQNTYQKLPKA